MPTSTCECPRLCFLTVREWHVCLLMSAHPLETWLTVGACMGGCGDRTLGALGTQRGIVTWAWAPEPSYGLAPRGLESLLYLEAFLSPWSGPCPTPKTAPMWPSTQSSVAEEPQKRLERPRLFLLYLCGSPSGLCPPTGHEDQQHPCSWPPQAWPRPLLCLQPAASTDQ